MRGRQLSLSVLLLTTCLLGSGLLGTGAEQTEAAEERHVVVVLDRGEQARSTSEGDAGNALRIVSRLQERGSPALLLALGQDEKGRPVTKNLDPTPAGIGALSEEEDYAFRGPTDARVALKRALTAHTDESPLDVILIGPFHAPPLEEGRKDALSQVPLKWSEEAPAGSRILPVRLTPGALASLEGAGGLLQTGWLVAGVGAPEIKVAPYSPLPGAEGARPPLRARVRLMVDVLPLGSTETLEPVVEVLSDVAEDRIRTTMLAGRHTFELERTAADGKVAALRFRAIERDGLEWLVEPPQAISLRWDVLAPGVRLVGPRGESPPTFAAIDVEAGAPYESSFRLRRSRSGPTPAWRASFPEGTQPIGLQVVIGDEIKASDEIAETEVRVRFSAQRAQPMKAQGAILLTADGVTEALRIPYELRVLPGRARLLVTSVPQALPPTASDPRSTIEFKSDNANVPQALRVAASSPEEQTTWLQVHVRGADDSVRTLPLDTPFSLQVNASYELSFTLLPATPEALPWPCEITLRAVPREGVEIEGEGRIELRRRQPRLKQVGSTPVFELLAGKVVSDSPLRFAADMDGGEGDWALHLLKTAPVPRVDGPAPIGWKTVGAGTGQWDLTPSGTWTGPAPGIFDAQEVSLRLSLTWAGGAAPAPIDVLVRVPPKWGNKGFVLLGFAIGALLLGLIVFTQMRSAPVTGTLIYTVDGLEGTVGRLDLSPIARRAHVISADERGRLKLGKEGDAFARIQPTRVGGMLEIPTSEGKPERRLLVDGLSLRVGRHLVRYVSGVAGESAPPPEPVPDLLGEEFDLESGRIEALGSDPSGRDHQDVRGDPHGRTGPPSDEQP